jgi:hypothetical protein
MLANAKKKEYWADILEQFDGLHKLSLQPAESPEGEARAQQLVAQTGPVTERKHFYRTEVHQLQDWCLRQDQTANSAAVLDTGLAIVQTTAARPAMFTKDRWDKKSARWCKENPLRVCDVKYALEQLWMEEVTPFAFS